MGGLGAKLGKGWCDVYPKRTLFYSCIFYICANFGENPPRNASVGVHADGDADWFYNLYYAITGCAVAPALCYAGTLKQFNSLDHSNRYKFMKLKKSKMAAAAILKIQKSPYLGNGLTDRHSNWHDDAHWPAEPDQQLKFRTFKNPRRWTAAILKNRKM